MKITFIASALCEWENEDYKISSAMVYKLDIGKKTTGNVETQIFCKKPCITYRLNTELSNLMYPEEIDEENNWGCDCDGACGSPPKDTPEADKYYDLYVNDPYGISFLLSIKADVLCAVLDCHFEAMNGALAVRCGYIAWDSVNEVVEN